MKRAKKKKAVTEVKALRYKKVSGGVHLHNGRRIVKGDIVEAYPGDLPELFIKNDYVCLDGDGENMDTGSKLVLRPAGNGKFNIVNSRTDEPLNDKPLTAKEAAKFPGIESEESEDEEDEDTGNEGEESEDD